MNNYIINWCKTIFSKIWILQLLSSRVWRIFANSDLPPSLWNQTPKIQVKLFCQCCILLNISPCADISMLKHHKAKFNVQIWMQILIRHTLASELISFLFMSTLKAVLVDTIVPHSSKWELNIERAITTSDCSCRRH